MESEEQTGEAFGKKPLEDARVLDYAPPPAGELVVVAHFPNIAQARVAARRLDDMNIVVEIVDLMPADNQGYCCANLAVIAEDVVATIEILQNMPAGGHLIRRDIKKY